MDFEFEKSLNKLRELYETDKSILKRINTIINDAKYGVNSDTKYDINYDNSNESITARVIKEIKIDIFLLVVIAILIVLVGFFNVSNIGLYLFGLAFFLSGLCIGLFAEGFGLIFLFSHGITGLCVMMSALLSKILENPILNDGPLHSSIVTCGIIVVSLFVVATLLTIIHNLSTTVRSSKYAKVIVLFLYFLGFLITGLYVNFFPLIY